MQLKQFLAVFIPTTVLNISIFWIFTYKQPATNICYNNGIQEASRVLYDEKKEEVQVMRDGPCQGTFKQVNFIIFSACVCVCECVCAKKVT